MSNYQSNEIKLINTSLIDPHPDNPRKQIGDVTDLAASIKANGLLSPLSVVPNGERYRVIAGHRRLAACKQAGTGAVPCFVLDLDPLQQLEAMVTENCQREQLTTMEESDAIQGMLDFIPPFVLAGFGVAANILPAMGFAMLGRLVLTKQLVPFYFLGFLLCSYANVPVLGVALIAIIIGIDKFDLLGLGGAQPQLSAEGDEDDDF